MKRKTNRINLDRRRLLAFSQITGSDGSGRSPAMTMFGTKICKKKRKPAV